MIILHQLISAMTPWEYGLTIFFLIFAMVYSLLQKIEIFKFKKDLSGVVSAMTALVVASTLYMDNILLLGIPVFAGIIVFLFFSLMIVSMLYGDVETIPFKVKRMLGIACIVTIAFFIFWELVPGFMGQIGGALNTALNPPAHSTATNTTTSTINSTSKLPALNSTVTITYANGTTYQTYLNGTRVQ